MRLKDLTKKELKHLRENDPTGNPTKRGLIDNITTHKRSIEDSGNTPRVVDYCSDCYSIALKLGINIEDL